MFTGLVTDVGRLVGRKLNGETLSLLIATGPQLNAEELDLGESVAVDGVCLTVVSKQHEAFCVDLSFESSQRTSLFKKRVGEPLHLERALRLHDRLGGHLMTGHVDGVGTLLERRVRSDVQTLRVDYPQYMAPYLVQKGSVAVDGVSLTVNDLKDDCFSVILVPETLKRTYLASKIIGGMVNLETDLLGKYVVRRMALQEAGCLPDDDLKESSHDDRKTLDLLKRQGFLS